MVLQAGDRVPNRHRLRTPKNTNMRKLPPSRVNGLSPAKWEIVTGLTMPILFFFFEIFLLEDKSMGVVIPSRTLWGSWAKSLSVSLISLITGNRLHSPWR